MTQLVAYVSTLPVLPAHAFHHLGESVKPLVQCCDEEFEVEKFRDEMKASLPRYAVPCEVKVQAEPLPVTSTLKIPAQSRIKEIVRDA